MKLLAFLVIIVAVVIMVGAAVALIDFIDKP